MNERLEAYDFDLPSELIAQEPAAEREDSRLLVVDRRVDDPEDRVFRDLPAILKPGDLLVANQSRVISARLIGTLDTGGRIEMLLIRERGRRWEVMARPARKLKPGTRVTLAGGVSALVEESLPEGRRVVRFEGVDDFPRWLETAGRAPLPPYIHRYPDDPSRYQTVYAESRGSVAAPTAGLHFTENLIDRLRNRDIELVFVTLHVGPGTFQPLTGDRLRTGRLEAEWGSIDNNTAQSIVNAKESGRRVIAVGTTTTRLLEGVAQARYRVEAWSGELELFIRRPFEFRVIDGLITNFHLPRSSLLVLVSTLAGHDRIMSAYAHAIAQRYRFYSFGDAMLIL